LAREIGNIYLSWRKGFGARRHIVGVLKRNVTDGIRFSYLENGVKDASMDGFRPYPEFPEISRTYSEDVIEIFGQRIIRSDRNDISEFLRFWEIDPKYRSDKFYLLARTQGLNPADNFEFLADYRPIPTLKFVTDLAGLSATKLPHEFLSTGDALTYSLEPQNQYDQFAVKVFKGTANIGYIKQIHCRVFHKAPQGSFQIRVKAVDVNGIIKRVFLLVEMTL
jgi:hypothetical protein